MARPKSMTEKVTINIDPVDLGYIDLLVYQGFYGNRSDFIKNAVKTRLHDYDDQFKEIQRKERNTGEWVVGITRIGQADVAKNLAEHRQSELHVIGYLTIDRDVDPDELQAAYPKITINGVMKASKEIKDRYGY
ncbi:hypothetical protein [Schleiferilactobacillus harbinensis]|uniref:hypothetical protein n=1 Tax=Schleiferilactobacillus harbinensis TaxID=304207 RepID=UPI0007B90BA8|nr:hypothetical protein [Schleiferilactobacillus harbinensis]